jgi:non-ribosomal peptide synthetase component F
MKEIHEKFASRGFTIVAVCLERSLEMVVGLLAILKAGGVYAAFDPSQPKARFASMLEDVEAPVLLTTEKLLPSLPDSSFAASARQGSGARTFQSAATLEPSTIWRDSLIPRVLYEESREN